jgi:ribonuclease P protein component
MPGFPRLKDPRDEAYFSTLSRAPKTHPRFSRPDADPRRPGGHPGPPRQGPHPARHLIVAESAAATARLRLRRHQRLGAADVAAVLKSGTLTRSARLSVYRRPNDLDCPRLALIVPKRLAPLAVTRNRIRRIVREAFRLQQRALGPEDCVVRLVKAPGKAPISRGEVEAVLLRSANV